VNCCEVPVKTEHAQSKALAVCAACHSKAKKVERLTVEHLIKDERLEEVRETQYYFCETPSCEVVYFSNETGQYLRKGDVRVRVGIKETEDPIPICYCFDFTEKMVRDQLLETGTTIIPDAITQEIRAGRCACEVKNPSGRCCLGEVKRSVNRVQAQLKLAAQPGAARKEGRDCCSLKPGLSRHLWNPVSGGERR